MKVKFKKNAKGLYYHRFTTPKNANGATVRMHVQCKAEYNSTSALSELIRQACQRHVEGKFTTSETLTSYVKEKFMVDYPPTRNLTTSSRYVLGYCLDRVCDEIGAVPLGAIDASVIARMTAGLQKRTTEAGVRRYSDRTVHQIVGALGIVLRWAVKVKDLSHRPEIERPKVTEFRKPQPYTREEAQQLIAAAANDEEHAIFMLLFDAGLRRGEILGLQFDQIDFARHILTVNRQAYHGVMRHTKSGRERKIRMSPQLEAALSKIRGPRPLVFCGDDGAPHASRWLYLRFRGACKRAGLHHTRVHDGRHAFASFASDDGMPTFALQRILGHSDIRTTQGYVHPTPPAPRSVLDPDPVPPAEHRAAG